MLPKKKEQAQNDGDNTGIETPAGERPAAETQMQTITNAAPRPAPNIKILQNHLIWALTHNSENLLFSSEEGNMEKFYVLITGIEGLNDCFKGGQYLIVFDTTKTMGPLKQSYPYEPPTFLFLTPNGKYGTDAKVCVSFGEFHNHNYKQDLGFAGFAELLVQGMVSTEEIGAGIRIIDCQSIPILQKHAKESIEYNIKKYHKEIFKLYIIKLMLVESGAYNEDKNNTDRLIKNPDDKFRKTIARKIMIWDINAKVEITADYIKKSLIESDICKEISEELNKKIINIIQIFT